MINIVDFMAQEQEINPVSLDGQSRKRNIDQTIESLHDSEAYERLLDSFQEIQDKVGMPFRVAASAIFAMGFSMGGKFVFVNEDIFFPEEEEVGV